VVRGDAVISRLLFLRERWDLQLDEAELSLVSDVFDDRPDSASREEQWLRESRHAWSCLDAAHLAWRERRQPNNMPAVLHTDWFAVDDANEAPGYASKDYREWLACHPGATAEAGQDRNPPSPRASFAATRRGLIAISSCLSKGFGQVEHRICWVCHPACSRRSGFWIARWTSPVMS
jgi:hypothetical protein